MVHSLTSHYSQRMKKGQRDEVVNALFRIMATVPEAKRFPAWLECVLYVFSTCKETVVGDFFGMLFENWSLTCRTVLKGPAAFEPIFRYLTYADAFSAVSVVSNKLKEKRKVAEAATAVVVTNPAVAFLPDYDFKDDSEGTTSSENVLVAEEGDTTEDEIGDAEMMPRRRIQRGQPRMRMPRAQPRRMAPIQRQRKNGKACFFLAVLFLLLLIVLSFWLQFDLSSK